jgi:hypothetical protein
MTAWAVVVDRVRLQHERTDWVMYVLQRFDCVALCGDEGDPARILLAVKAVLDECTKTNDFSEVAIQLAALGVMA